MQEKFLQKGFIAMYEKLNAALESKHITKYRLAKLTGIHEQDIYNLFSGKKKLFAGWKTRIAEALEMSEEDLFD